jgi:CheY-like chemotaxis protein
MDNGVSRLLLVEDDPAYARLIEALLGETRAIPFLVDRADRLASAMARADRGDIDVVLLDLGLPDSNGLETFRRMRERCAAPIIVLTGMDDDELALEAVWAGAQDFLVKGKFDHKLLEHTLRYSIQREVVRRESDRVRRDREMSSLHRMARAPESPWAQGGNAPVVALPSAAQPDLATRYGELLEMAPGRRNSPEVDVALSEGLRVLADRLGEIWCGPADVAQIHDQVLRTRTDGLPPQKALVFLEEGRRMVLELMGHLVAHYRARAHPRVAEIPDPLG